MIDGKQNPKFLRSLQNAQRVMNFAVKATVVLVFRYYLTFLKSGLTGVINGALVSIIIIIIYEKSHTSPTHKTATRGALAKF